MVVAKVKSALVDLIGIAAIIYLGIWTIRKRMETRVFGEVEVQWTFSEISEKL